MKSMIVFFSVVAVAMGQWQGAWNTWNGLPAPVQDTPEVAAAKAAHLAALAQARGAVAPVSYAAPAPVVYSGPVALPPGYDLNGAPLPVLDTPEVAALKAERLNTLAASGGHVPIWNTPAPLNGVPADTPEVAAAKAAHFAAHAAIRRSRRSVVAPLLTTYSTSTLHGNLHPVGRVLPAYSSIGYASPLVSSRLVPTIW